MMTRVWIAGGRGMLGQAVVQRLEAFGHAVLVTGREVDISDGQAVMAYARTKAPTHIINCAAYTKVDACESDTEAAEASNTSGPKHLAEAAAALHVPIAHVSTDYVFDGTADSPYAEDDPCAPLGVYGRTKHGGEEAFWAAFKGASDAARGYVVRTSWLFGHGGPNFVQTMLRLMGSKAKFSVVSDQFGRPTFCGDLAAAIVQLMGLGPSALGAAPTGAYHFANAGAVSWYDFAQGIFAEAKAGPMALTCASIQAIATQDYPTPAQRPAYSVLCTDKIAQALGYVPRPWEQALSAYLSQHWLDVQAAQTAAASAALPSVASHPNL